jgi:threonyl-tRNA synthetase
MEPELDPDDHRALAARLDLLHFQDEAPGMVFWHPRGFTLYRLLEDAAGCQRADVGRFVADRPRYRIRVTPSTMG